MVRSRTGAWLITATVAAVVTATMGSAPALAATAADQIAQLDAVKLVGTQWRAKLAPTLAAATEFKKDKTVKEPLRGKLLARTLRLPARIELSADAAIIADSVVLAERTLSIEAHGHKLTILPVSAVRSEASTGRAGLNFEANGTDGQAGSAGAGGEAGQTGQSGEPGGTFYDPSQQCDVGRTGGGGSMGGSGKTGGQGGSGTQGTAGGSLNFDVPNGSTESYAFSARGGKGGDGGYGGTGGAGGTGGTGGAGGDTSCPAWSSVGGDGGPGGQGGSAGNGGNGGGGGSGGHGGTITVSYPPGYDPARISADAAGGAGGGSGPPGTPGTVGFGGMGGQGGRASASGQYGQQGWPGMPGMTAFFGSAGPGGTNGADGSVSLNGRPTTLTLTTDAPAYEVGQQARYTLSGGTPNSPICWSSTRNGTPVEVNSCTAQTDGFGGWSGLSPVWTDADVGSWTKSATVSGRTVSAPFSVAPAVPVTIATDSSYYPPYTAGTMTVTGPPNQPIYWTTWHNGQPTFEQNSQFGQTDASGRFSRSIPAWQWSDQVGTYVTQARIGARTAQVSYDLGYCGYTWSGGKVFASGELYIGCKGTFAMQGDGNLVIYDEIGRAKWASNTYSPGAFAAIQGDGNLVIYTTYGYAIWASNTYSPGATLSFQGDGNLVIYTWYGYPIWASNTGH